MAQLLQGGACSKGRFKSGCCARPAQHHFGAPGLKLVRPRGDQAGDGARPKRLQALLPAVHRCLDQRAACCIAATQEPSLSEAVLARTAELAAASCCSAALRRSATPPPVRLTPAACRAASQQIVARRASTGAARAAAAPSRDLTSRVDRSCCCSSGPSCSAAAANSTPAHLLAVAVDHQKGLAAARHQLAHTAIHDGVACHAVPQLQALSSIQHAHQDGTLQAVIAMQRQQRRAGGRARRIALDARGKGEPCGAEAAGCLQCSAACSGRGAGAGWHA
ncbi:hypothetical protein ABPG77_000925 [Micractinium sp. CCAP 211/92]